MPEKDQLKSIKPKDNRSRSWVFIVYPDSAPEGWLDVLRDLHVPGFVSPLHEPGVNPETGEILKPHHHVLLMFASKKSVSQVTEITEKINATRPDLCQNVRGYARYLCHLDSPEKQQFNPSDVTCLAGADYFAKALTDIDLDKTLSAILDWCTDTGCVSLFELDAYARRHRPDWFKVLQRRTYYISKWLKAFAWEQSREK